MFALAKISYYACNQRERLFYDNMETEKIDLQLCCETLLGSMRTEMHSDESRTVVQFHKG